MQCVWEPEEGSRPSGAGAARGCREPTSGLWEQTVLPAAECCAPPLCCTVLTLNESRGPGSPVAGGTDPAWAFVCLHGDHILLVSELQLSHLELSRVM